MMPGPSPTLATSPALRLGTRNSPLALAQAEEARLMLAAVLAAADGPGQVDIVSVTASGDKVLDRPLAEIGGKALWTKELDGWLLGGAIDCAVHSAKDVETIRPAGLVIGAVLPRADVRDCLIGAASLAALAPGARIGTCAPRRAAQALHARPDCRIVPFRGNVATRLGKLAAGEADATLLAAAGLNRLGLGGTGTLLEAGAWLPAPGQGAILIECRADDARTRAALARIDDAPSRDSLVAERHLLAALGGTCHSPIAALTRAGSDGFLTMEAALFSPDGAEKVRGEARFAPGDHAAVEDLAARLLIQASAAITRHFSLQGST